MVSPTNTLSHRFLPRSACPIFLPAFYLLRQLLRPMYDVVIHWEGGGAAIKRRASITSPYVIDE